MPDRPYRVIVDTNLLISLLITNQYKHLDQPMIEGRLILLFSEESVNEFLEVSQRPKFEKHFSLDDITELLFAIHTFSELITVNKKVDLCRDPKDNFLLALALESKASHLITGDRDLLDLQLIGHTQILSMADFLLELKLI